LHKHTYSTENKEWGEIGIKLGRRLKERLIAKDLDCRNSQIWQGNPG